MKILAVLCLLFAASALADEPDTLVLKDGTVLRGHVAELHPKQSVTITLLDGQSRQLSWAEVASARGPSFGEQAEEEVDIFKPGAGRAPLQIDAARRQSITIHARADVGINGIWLTFTRQNLCSTPCTLYLPSGHYWVEAQGEGVVNSVSEVELGGEGRRLRLHSSSSKLHGGGAALTAVGTIAVLAGVISMILPSIPDPSLSASGGPLLSADAANAAYVAGGVLGGAGLASIVAGAILLHGTPSGVEKAEPYSPSRPSPNGPVILDAWVTPQRSGGAAGVSLCF